MRISSEGALRQAAGAQPNSFKHQVAAAISHIKFGLLAMWQAILKQIDFKGSLWGSDNRLKVKRQRLTNPEHSNGSLSPFTSKPWAQQQPSEKVARSLLKQRPGQDVDVGWSHTPVA